MCDEKNLTKTCHVCGKELSINLFAKHGRSKDGYEHICRSCKTLAKVKNKHTTTSVLNPKLSEFTPHELIDELKARGYTGKLMFTQIREIVI